jgi:ABC-type tungstate transport system permease subunit
MKTAMQELIEIFNHELKLEEATLSNDEGYMLKWAIFNAKSLLEKEKEQMLNFYMWMRMNENAEKYLDYSDEDMFKEYLNKDK